MRILCIHSDFLEVEPVSKAIEDAEDVEKVKKRIEDCLVVFCSIEKQDENKKEEILNEAYNEIKDVLEKIKSKRLVLYPFVHLSSNPSSPSFALSVLKDLENKLSEEYEVYRAPFGWYKKFTISCKGHPLAELSREVKGTKEEELEEEEDEGKIEDVLVILPGKGILRREDLGDEEKDVKRTIALELKEIKESSFGTPPHLKLMRKFEICEPELRVSDSGNMRYYPNGELMINLLMDWGRKVCEELGSFFVRTPAIINPNEKSVSIMMGKFPERLYKVYPGSKEKTQEFRLRPACDYGVWSIFKDAVVTYKQLPFRIFEYDIFWRYEQRGEVLGLYRLRNATMANVHTICLDANQTFEEFERQTEKFAMGVYNAIGVKPSAIVLNCKKDFFDTYKEVFKKWADDLKIPFIIKLFKTTKTYKVAWIDVLAFDNLGRAMEVSTVQLDTSSSAWWDIKYIAEDGSKKYPFGILHTGFGPERVLAALLENAAAMEKIGKVPMLPFWLSPVQARIIPTSPDLVPQCERILKNFEKVRIDIDDTDNTLAKKIKNAEELWIPFIIVIGPKELEKNVLSVRIRETREKKEMSIQELKELFAKLQKDMPFRNLPYPVFVSKRPIFVG
ncbi:MAG: threonine--tRNA ligase [archaeon]